ncbi:AAA family ATPase [Chamaesiphon sp. OTE_75_metabat_556]|uniref:AAA family ATPase n=1 Tax=Chamaesiphon sp. OTE_75_metabat_556 TaxID=2964692 RepID=UPI00286BFE51|nr:AAA family ATPase [Chamaesiphon sp. OTE_75_metabat_556]
MSVIALINQKGGCAKSTTCVHLAAWLTKQGHKVAVVDADAQKSSSIWLASLDTQIAAHVIQSTDELLDRIPDLAKECDYLLVDGAAGLSESSRAILMRTDLAIVPCQPTGLDLHSASEAVRLVLQAQSIRSGAPKAVVFLSRAVKGTKLLGEAQALLGQSGIQILKTSVHQRQVVADTFGQAATVWDLSGRPAAESAREFEKLFAEVMEVLA